MKNVVVAGSAKLQDKISHWFNYWKNQNYNILDYPVPIEEENFLKEYPDVHRDFFKNIAETDVIFIMNEDKMESLVILVQNHLLKCVLL